jgi:uncharacterized membrane protein YbhN (UPF0104 family)
MVTRKEGMFPKAKTARATSVSAAAHKLPRGSGSKILLFVAKFAVTGVCFWYVFRQLDLTQVAGAFVSEKIRWVYLAALIVVMQIVLSSVRWHEIIDALGFHQGRLKYSTVIAINLVASFFSQIVPIFAGEGIRVWYVVRFGLDWKSATISVIIDRGMGVASMAVIVCFILLLLPSELTGLAGYRATVLVIYGAALLCGALGLLLLPQIAPLPVRGAYLRWLAILASTTRRMLRVADRDLHRLWDKAFLGNRHRLDVRRHGEFAGCISRPTLRCADLSGWGIRFEPQGLHRRDRRLRRHPIGRHPTGHGGHYARASCERTAHHSRRSSG